MLNSSEVYSEMHPILYCYNPTTSPACYNTAGNTIETQGNAERDLAHNQQEAFKTMRNIGGLEVPQQFNVEFIHHSMAEL